MGKGPHSFSIPCFNAVQSWAWPLSQEQTEATERGDKLYGVWFTLDLFQEVDSSLWCNVTRFSGPYLSL